jgi:hypothetical protein
MSLVACPATSSRVSKEFHRPVAAKMSKMTTYVWRGLQVSTFLGLGINHYHVVFIAACMNDAFVVSNTW